jgi:hypothetical protein
MSNNFNFVENQEIVIPNSLGYLEKFKLVNIRFLPAWEEWDGDGEFVCDIVSVEDGVIYLKAENKLGVLGCLEWAERYKKSQECQEHIEIFDLVNDVEMLEKYREYLNETK